MTGDSKIMCDEVRLAISAQLDGEVPGTDPGAVRDHLRGCAGCRRWRAGAAELSGAPELSGVLALRTAAAPDRTEEIMAAVARDVPGGTASAATVAGDELYARRQILRLAVAVAAVVQLALAIPALVSALAGPAVGVGLHASREMASFDVAVAVGFLLAAARPARARAFLPVAVVLAGLLAATSGIDLARGATTLGHEIGHLVALAQAGLLWALTRNDQHSHHAVHGDGASGGPAGAGPVTA